MIRRTKEPEKLVSRLDAWVSERRGRGRIAARELGVTPQQLSNWINGWRRPSIDGYFAIQRFLAQCESLDRK